MFVGLIKIYMSSELSKRVINIKSNADNDYSTCVYQSNTHSWYLLKNLSARERTWNHGWGSHEMCIQGLSCVQIIQTER